MTLFQTSSRLAVFVARQHLAKKCLGTTRRSSPFLHKGSSFVLPTNDLFYRRFSASTAAVDNGTSSVPREKSIEEQYSKKTPLEHVLLRPGMYVGPVERLPPTHCWVLDPLPEPYDFSSTLDVSDQTISSINSFRMKTKEYGLVPALIKIFDEILVNATDNRLRDPISCTKLDVRIDPGSRNREPRIQIWNNGKGIPIHVHAHENMYVPEMLFGHLLTGSNFDDDEKRLTGGRHGYGAKLTNIFSKSFSIETVDSDQHLRYQQTWYDNMTKSSPPVITPVDEHLEDYTCVTFVPDMSRLSGDSNSMHMDVQDYAIMCRRVVDAAGCAAGKLQVFLNGKNVSIYSYADYSSMYRDDESPKLCFVDINSRWTVGVGLSSSNSFESVSFVNGMSTPRGGTHVNSITNQVVKKMQETVAKLEPQLSSVLNNGLIRRNLFVSCNALIENPTFDSQMKEYLTSNPSNFGGSYQLSEQFLAQLVESEEDGGPGIVEEVIRVARGRQQASLFKEIGGKKTKRQLLSIPKLEDAHAAGSEYSSECTIILTEGDSAKALAIAGLEVIGREKYGVFPLRGKFLNVRHATVDQLSKNAEVKALVAIMGLDFDKEYDTLDERKELRYGHIMLMTDQDTDGSHIKGLVINFFRHFWPKLLQPAVDDPSGRPVMSSFVTPLLKASRKNEELSFYSMADYNSWRALIDDPKQWKIKYYKGLGTSTPAEAKVYFSEFERHHKPFLWTSDYDGELLDKVFDKTRAADRRDWIANEYDPEATLDFSTDGDRSVTFSDFVNKEMIHFSNADNIRSLPSAIDGLKPSQRKVLYACFKRKLKSEIKVAQLSGFCAEHTAYHHGEQSLQGTIIGMAQDFVGSNNLNLLIPSGQFGTRLDGGDDAASSRYIFTYLAPATRYLFPEDDDVLLQYLEDDGQRIEPKYYCPIIPLVLVNGSQGIGTGWSTFIPPHHPMSVLDYIRRKLDGETQLPPIEPYARGFRGRIERADDGKGYVTYGIAKKLDAKTVKVEELPVGVWTSKYKQNLLRMQNDGVISDFVEDHTTTKVSFTIRLKPSQLQRMEAAGLEKSFRLKSTLALTNMNAFDENGHIKKFHTAEAIADAYFPVRLSLYHQRKAAMQAQMEYTASKQRNRARFIQLVSAGKIDLLSGKISKQEASRILKYEGFSTSMELNLLKSSNNHDTELPVDDLDENATNISVEDSSGDSGFDYLLTMPLFSLTTERIDSLNKEAQRTEEELKTVRATKPEELWMSDLEKLAKHL